MERDCRHGSKHDRIELGNLPSCVDYGHDHAERRGEIPHVPLSIFPVKNPDVPVDLP